MNLVNVSGRVGEALFSKKGSSPFPGKLRIATWTKEGPLWLTVMLPANLCEALRGKLELGQIICVAGRLCSLHKRIVIEAVEIVIGEKPGSES